MSNEEITHKEFLLAHRLIDHVQMEKLKTEAEQPPRLETIKKQAYELMESQDLEIPEALFNKKLNELIPTKEKENLTNDDFNLLLANDAEQRSFFLKNQKTIPSHREKMNFLNQLACYGEFNTNPFLIKTIVYYYSQMNRKREKRNMFIKKTLFKSPFFTFMATFNLLAVLLVVATELTHLEIFGSSLLTAFFISIYPAIKEKTGIKQIDVLIPHELIEESFLFENAIKKLKLINVPLNKKTELNQPEISKFIIKLSHHHFGKVILEQYRQNKGTLSVFDLGLLGASFPELLE